MFSYYFVDKYNTTQPIKYEISSKSMKTIASFKDYLSDIHQIPSSHIEIYEIFNHKIYRIFTNLDLTSSISFSDIIYVYELPKVENSLLIPIEFTYSSSPLVEPISFGSPFLVRITAETQQKYLFDLIQKLLKRHFKDEKYTIDFENSIILENIFHYSCSYVLKYNDEPILNQLNVKSKNIFRVIFKSSIYNEIFKLNSFIDF